MKNKRKHLRRGRDFVQLPSDGGPPFPELEAPKPKDQLKKVQAVKTRYSDELANGDPMDDLEMHEEEDMNDDVVDYQGQTNAGYGARSMMWLMKHNNIDDLGFGTAVPDIPDEDASDELAIGAPVAALVNVGNETT